LIEFEWELEGPKFIFGMGVAKYLGYVTQRKTINSLDIKMKFLVIFHGQQFKNRIINRYRELCFEEE